MFQLTSEEKAELVANCDHLSQLKFSKSLPYAFTEHGAIHYVVRAFVHLRELVLSHQDLTQKLHDLEQRIGQKLESHDQAIVGLINMVRELMSPKQSVSTKPIGFVLPTDKSK